MEVMVVVVIIGILSSMASVLWTRFSGRINARGGMDELRNAIQLARSDAITRRRNSGILIDKDSLRYLRFIDSSATGAQNGRYDLGEVILQKWTKLPSKLVFFNIVSSIPTILPPQKCDQPASTSIATPQSGQYSIVFRSDGSSMGTFQAKLGVESFPDTFHLVVLPPTGWVLLEK